MRGYTVYSPQALEESVHGLPRVLSTVIALSLIALPLAGCVSSTECDCVPLQVIVFGTVTGSTAPIAVEVRMGPGACQDGVLPTDGVGAARPEQDGSYRIGIPLPRPGDVCVVVTATTLGLPMLTTTRRLGATITAPTSGDPQRIRADLAFGSP
jgi:hypothetical protein